MNILARNIFITRHILKGNVKEIGKELNTFRLLYTRKELGIIHFENLRLEAQNSFEKTEDIVQYKSSIGQFFMDLPLNQKRDELKKFIVLIDNNDNDHELVVLKEILQAYNTEYHSIAHKVKSFTFGAPIMRLFYWRNSPDLALQFFNDETLAGTFEQQETYKVLFDLLYKNQRYNEIYELYETKRKYIAKYNVKFDKTIDCLVFAACYHLNTRSHMEYAIKLWNSVQSHNISKRCKCFVAALALKQGEAELALSLIENNQNHVTPRFICLIAYTSLGHFHAAFELLENVIKRSKDGLKSTIGEQMIKSLEIRVKESGTNAQKDKFRKIAKTLKDSGLISDETLDYHLCKLFPEMPPKNVFRKLKKKQRQYECEEEKLH